MTNVFGIATGVASDQPQSVEAPAPAQPPDPSPSVTDPTVEQKILAAANEVSIVSSLFAPQVGQAVKLGIAIEPIIHSFVSMFANIFHHHTGVAPQVVSSHAKG